MMKVLIAVDGSEHSDRAIEAVGRMAKNIPELKPVLLNVREGPIYRGEFPVFDPESMDQLQRRRQDEVLQAALVRAEKCGLQNATTQAAIGSAAAEIIRVAAEHAADQIAMGTRGMTVLGGLLLGSVAQQVIQKATIPVLLVK